MVGKSYSSELQLNSKGTPRIYIINNIYLIYTLTLTEETYRSNKMLRQLGAELFWKSIIFSFISEKKFDLQFFGALINKSNHIEYQHIKKHKLTFIHTWLVAEHMEKDDIITE